jgi:hypothetical protein
MSDQTRTFTGTFEAMHANELRRERDLTDAQIQARFLRNVDDERIARERASAAATRGRWEREAAVSAVHVALNRASDAAAREFPSLDYDNETVSIEALDLEGATITVTIADLIATATVTVPTLGA